MDKITTLFSAIGDYFQNSGWYPMIKWPFWTLLFVVAAGGVYCARFGKKTLLSQGISSTLSIISVYLCTILFCTIWSPARDDIALPFLSITQESAVLVDPFTLAPEAVSPTLLRLMILVFLINTADSFGSGGKSFPTWLLTEAAAMGIALVLYILILTGTSAILPQALSKFAIIPVVLIIALSLVVICAKIFFTKFFTKENKYYKSMNKFFMENRMGTLLTSSAMSFTLGAVLLFILHIREQNVVNFAAVNRWGLFLILAMILLVQFIYEIFYQDRKKA